MIAARIAGMRFIVWTPLAAALCACAPEAAVSVKAPRPETPAAQSDWKQVEPSKQKMRLVPDPVGVPAADASCAEYVAHPSQPCPEQSQESSALARALDVRDPTERDAQLSCLEPSSAFASGFMRALRAELAPPVCGDVLTLPLLEAGRSGLDRRLEDTLIALAAAGRLSRLVRQAPELPAPFDRAHFMDFFQTTLKPWIVTQAQAIHDLALVGLHLLPYAKGVVAVEAGLADMRFVSVVRTIPLPKEMNDDAEVRDAYYAALDEALEPRKARGRDAALVGLRELSEEGVVFDRRVERARALLSEVYAGRRIDALDKLLLPVLPARAADTTERSLAARLPSFYAGVLLDGTPLDAPLLRALMERGLPKPFAARLDPEKLDPASRALLTRALFDRGRVYLRAEDFVRSSRLSAVDTSSPEQVLYHALASSLQNGPRDASDLLLRGPGPPTLAADVKELDRVAAEPSSFAAIAAFDAAYLLSLDPPQNDPQFWKQLGQRFDRAARALGEPAWKQLAQSASTAAKDTERTLRSSSKGHSISPPARAHD